MVKYHEHETLDEATYNNHDRVNYGKHDTLIVGAFTMTVINEIKLKRDEIERIAKENGIIKISIFGSVAKGSVHEDSDIDFLIEIE